MRCVLRVDLEVEAVDIDAARVKIRCALGFANDKFKPEHYQWRIVQLDDGLLNPDLEKTMAKPIIGASFRG